MALIQSKLNSEKDEQNRERNKKVSSLKSGHHQGGSKLATTCGLLCGYF